MRDGFLIIDKPAGMTSFDVIRRLRRILGIKKMGHAGTLDSFATGVLVIGIGTATKKLGEFLHGDKEYIADVLFGVETDTYDVTGRVVQVASDVALAQVTESRVRRSLEKFVGDIEQMPPQYSALKIRGQRAADRVRAGETVVLKPRKIRVYEIVVENFQTGCASARVPERVFPCARLRVRASGGMYVRALAHDLGLALGVGAHLASLQRTQVGPHRIEKAVPLDLVTPTISLISHTL